MNPGIELDALNSNRWVFVSCNKCDKKYQTRRIYVERGGGRYCSKTCFSLSRRKHEVINFNGVNYYLSAGGYMVNPELGLRMHREIWIHYYDKIPKGYIVHHINGIKTDNRIENLQLQEWGAHTSEHTRERWKNGLQKGKPPSIACCSPGCIRKSKAKKLCTLHYQRMKALERGKWL